MPYLPETSRRVAHVILDTISSIDHEGDSVTNEIALLTALEGLDEAGAVTVTSEDGADADVRVDISDLFFPVLLLVDRLAGDLAEERGSGELDVIAELRSYIDTLPPPAEPTQ